MCQRKKKMDKASQTTNIIENLTVLIIQEYITYSKSLNLQV